MRTYSQGFPGPGLGYPHQVLPAQGHRETLRLDCRWLFEILLHQHVYHILCQKDKANSCTAFLLTGTVNVLD